MNEVKTTITLTNEYGRFTVELDYSVPATSDVLESLILPLLMAAGYYTTKEELNTWAEEELNSNIEETEK